MGEQNCRHAPLTYKDITKPKAGRKATWDKKRDAPTYKNTSSALIYNAPDVTTV